MKNLIIRTIIALIFAPLIMLLFWKGGIIFAAFLALLSIGMVIEFNRFNRSSFNIFQKILLFTSAIGVNYVVFVDKMSMIPVIIAGMFILFSLSELKNEINGSLSRLGMGFFTFIYLIIGPALAFRINHFSPWFAIFILAIIWTTDSFAYFVGMLIGKHKMAEKISPKKTIEGLFGGLMGGLGIAILFHYLSPETFPLVKTMIVGLGASLVAQYGDLLESKLKREAGIKDSGSIIPGHGGLLDRFDSFLMITPLMYILLHFGVL